MEAAAASPNSGDYFLFYCINVEKIIKAKTFDLSIYMIVVMSFRTKLYYSLSYLILDDKLFLFSLTCARLHGIRGLMCRKVEREREREREKERGSGSGRRSRIERETHTSGKFIGIRTLFSLISTKMDYSIEIFAVKLLFISKSYTSHCFWS